MIVITVLLVATIIASYTPAAKPVPPAETAIPTSMSTPVIQQFSIWQHFVEIFLSDVKATLQTLLSSHGYLSLRNLRNYNLRALLPVNCSIRGD
jgi:hypothetical protein